MGFDKLSRAVVPAMGTVGAALAVREVAARFREADLQGQVALVTGGSRGLGLAMARELAAQGCRLALCARDETDLRRARDELQASGADVMTIACDVADRDDVAHMVETVHAQYGRIDVLVCNAGVIQVGEARSTELEDYEQAMDIMYWGVLHPILAVLPEMRARKSGRIAVVTSIGGKISVPRLLPYNAAKFASVGLAEGLHAELANDGITVTTIVPGLTRTGSYLHAQFSGDEEGRLAQYQMFAPMSSLPLLTSSAESSARRFVRAIRRGEAEVIYPPQYALVARVHGVAPGLVMKAMMLADRLMAPSGEGTTTVPGTELDPRIDSQGWRWLTTLGRRAGRDLHQRP